MSFLPNKISVTFTSCNCPKAKLLIEVLIFCKKEESVIFFHAMGKGRRTRVGPMHHVLDRGSHWRHLADTTDWSMRRRCSLSLPLLRQLVYIRWRCVCLCTRRERLVVEWEMTGDLLVDLGTDQTSCHNPFNGGYYPVQVQLDVLARVR